MHHVMYENIDRILDIYREFQKNIILYVIKSFSIIDTHLLKNKSFWYIYIYIYTCVYKKF